MKYQKDNKYKYWLENPIKLDDNEISENITNDGSGFIIRDYRFHPKILADNIDNYKISDRIYINPSEIQLFYAWALHNKYQAIDDLKKHASKRKKSVKRGDRKRQQVTYVARRIGKLYYLYDDIIRNDLINIIQSLLKFKKDHELHLLQFNIILRKINLNIDDYNESIYKDFIIILLDLIRYIFKIKSDNNDLIPEMDKCISEEKINIKLNKLIVMSKTMVIANI